MANPATKSTALWVLRRLRKSGHQALFAGGCVRDMLLGIRSTDYDVATDATPQQVKRLFPHVLLVGAKFGVAMVIHRRRKVEVTTFRADLSYSDHRRPDAVRFTTPREDALRRDFTINGMFYDPIEDRVIDYVGGQKDLRRGVIRTIGPPRERFAEDYLRMVRAVRFAVRLGFQIEPSTARAIRQHAARISSVSGERIFDELSKMLSRKSARAATRMMDDLRLGKPIFPELFSMGLWVRSVRRVESISRRKDLLLALGALMVELPKKAISQTVRRWGASNELRDALCWLGEHLGDWRRAGAAPGSCPPEGPMPLCDFKRLMGNEHFSRLRVLWTVEERRETGRSVCSRRIARRVAEIPKDKIAPRPFVTGVDLIKMGLKEGPKLGRILRALYDAQLNEELLSRRAALKAAREMIR